jgi:uncharacterized membrane protein (UPF0127 family)
MPGMTAKNAQLRVRETGRVVVAHLEVASSLWTQTVGLMGRQEFAAGSGLLIPHCNAIHTAFVRFPIDVLFLDSQMTVMRLVSALSPWRIVGPVRGAKSVVELPAGTLRQMQIAVGQQFTVSRSDARLSDGQA